MILLASHQAYKHRHNEKAWVMLCHLSVFSSFLIPFGNIFGPLIVWLIKHEEFALVDDQGKESLNSRSASPSPFADSYDDLA